MTLQKSIAIDDNSVIQVNVNLADGSAFVSMESIHVNLITLSIRILCTVYVNQT